MATKSKNEESETTETSLPESDAGKKIRDIPGGLPYTTTPGVLKKVLESLINAERPDKFTGDFMGTVLKASGGSARAVPPILKKMGFLTSDGTPTDLYSKFKSDSGRSTAALDGLRRGFAEMFRRNEFIHRGTKDDARDLVIEITGLTKSDPVVGAIVGTFQVVRDFVDLNKIKPDEEEAKQPIEEKPGSESARGTKGNTNGISLVYNINIVLPESTNVQVFNSIFRSLKENLLKDAE